MFSSRVDLEAGDSLFAALHALGDLEALTGAFVFSVCDSYHCWHCWKCGCGDGPEVSWGGRCCEIRRAPVKNTYNMNTRFVFLGFVFPHPVNLILFFWRFFVVKPPKWRVRLQKGVLLVSGTGTGLVGWTFGSVAALWEGTKYVSPS